jgi:hypothetical protein
MKPSSESALQNNLSPPEANQYGDALEGYKKGLPSFNNCSYRTNEAAPAILVNVTSRNIGLFCEDYSA